MIPTRYNRMGINFHPKTTWIISHGSGVLDIQITGASNLLWIFPDGSTSTAIRPIKTVTAGNTIIRCDNFSANGLGVFIFNTSTALSGYNIPLYNIPDLRYLFYCRGNYLSGDISQLPRVTYYLLLDGCTGIYGSYENFPKVTNTFTMQNINISGTTINIPRTTYNLLIQEVPVSGSSSDLPNNTNIRAVYGTNVSGALSLVSTNREIYYFDNPNVTPAEYDQTISNCVASGATNGLMYISSRRTSASNANKATLISRGWTVNDSNI